MVNVNATPVMAPQQAAKVALVVLPLAPLERGMQIKATSQEPAADLSAEALMAAIAER